MNHQIKRAFMAMLLSVFCFVAYAQKTVTGTVVDAVIWRVIGFLLPAKIQKRCDTTNFSLIKFL